MNILLTSAGRRSYLVNYFKRALGGNGLVHASNSVLTYALQQADKYVITPNIYDGGYIEFLLDYCHKEKISAIISLFDVDLPVLARHKEEFADNGITVVVSDYDVTQICNDKWKTYAFLSGIGVEQSPACLSLDAVRAGLADGKLSFPIILKPRWGMGSIGIYEAEDEEELNLFYKKLNKRIFQTYLKYESSSAVDSCVLLQEKISGQEYGLEILNDLQGNYVTTIAKKKIAMRAGETDIAEIVDAAPFIEIGKNISTHLRHVANLDVDCFVTDSGKIIVLEMNCRFGGQYPFSHLAGVDFPKQIIEWLYHRPTDMSILTPHVGFTSCKDLCPVPFNS